ncbi:hypothetical protein NGM10_04660 [Halorussus salilacus]|uniref:hypothetical protein n=1 Tax=Halorussus salilacus TaxID=2953750 RepID=UPI00209E06CB|nr:hypothetical protein [Halorussus salilacus]USZ69031.1 hypothetical protein NGM10_04660 [Halorussus salilacus]
MTPDAAPGTRAPTAGFAAAALLVAAAFVGAATVGTLSTVGPYLLGISGLVAALFLVGFWGH